MTKARQIVKFIYNKQQALDIMRTYTKENELQRPENLRFMVASNDWRLVQEVEKDNARDITHLYKMKIFGIWEKK
ncbi:hypothetical protein EJ110_NYTH59761 [Nymphaea thermarum]|nr:hypothetical protein EJ110_NYTH59761 [Nymphaea thermarum]